jgi:hypothetical protein
MGVTMRAQGQILRANLRYLALNLKPLLVMIVPLILILAQLNLWFGSEPLAVGRSAILKVRLEPKVDLMGTEVTLETPPGIAIETPPLRIEEAREVDWRIKPASPGRFDLTVRAGGKSHLKTVVVNGRRLEKVSPVKVKRSFLDEVLYPGEKALPRESGIKAVEIVSATKKLPLLGLKLHWLIAYLGLSIIFGFALKKPFRVEI